MKASKKKKLKKQKDDTPINVNIEMTGKNMTVNSGLIPILNFMKKLKFSGVLRNNISIEQGSNSTYDIVDIIQMVIVSIIAGATAMTHIGVICNDEVIRKIAYWEIIPVDTTVGRIMRLFSFRSIVELTSSNHDFRSKVW
ncbi:transposase, partial [Candidatus Magnetobacterium bavaricum]